MLSNILQENNFNVHQFRTQYVTKPMGHAFGLRAKTMLLAQYKLFYVKEFLITDYSKAFCIAILGKWSHF
jgi:hypothetical protein